jgi:diguanylate cyclase (GGDEF)-like protein/PAS domain S-box-containing protein
MRLIEGWTIQGGVALQDLKKYLPFFSRDQREELDHLEKGFQLLKNLLAISAKQLLPSNPVVKQGPKSSFADIWSLERKLGMSMTVLSLSVRTSQGNAEKSLAGLETKWERIDGGLLVAFLVTLLGMEGWKLIKAQGNIFSKEAQLQGLFNAMQDAVLQTDLERRVRFANPAVEKIFGYAPSELIGQSAAIFYARQEDFKKQGELRFHPDAMDDSEPYEMDYRRNDGTAFKGEARGAVVRDPMGQVRGFMVTVRDITQRKEMMNRLSLEKEKWFVTLGSIGDAVIVTDVKARVEFLNPMAETLTGWSLQEAIGEPVEKVFDIISEITRKPAKSPVGESLRHGTIVGLSNHTLLRSRFGEEHAIEDSAAPIQNTSREVIGCVVVFRDVTQKRNLLRQVTHQANFDSLTDLPNRYLFQDRMNQMLLQARRLNQPVALLYLDLDYFKKINDSAGHPVGDLVLKEVARRLLATVRESDTVARLGGDEFAIIADGNTANPDNAVHLARKILDVMTLPFYIEGQELHFTASLGIAFFPGDGEDVTTLVRNADIAMYQAKTKGRNDFQFFSPSLNMTLQERTVLENQLYAAFEKDEFQLLYQPVVDFNLGRVVAVEALIRWQHPQQGLLSPATFIPIAEENGLILRLGEWVLEKACCQTQEWRNKGFPPLRMAVNVSTRQLTQENFPSLVEQWLRVTGLSPDFLELELTESVLLQNTDKVQDGLSRLHAMGVRLSIDDFGTGYSSLSYLTRFHVNTLKIDGAFVQGIETHPGNAAVITTILALGQAMSLDVVAEGVETLDQARFLTERHCTLLQGYLLSHPVTAHQISRILTKNFRAEPEILSGI